MEELAPFLVVVVPLAALSWFLGRRSGRRAHNPLWSAFTATSGYNLNAPDAAAAGTPWSGRVLWWEVGVGVALVPVAAQFWRRGIRSFSPGSLRGTRSTD